MKTIKKCILLLALAIAATPMVAQQYGRPTHHDSFADYFFSLGYQGLFHPSNQFHAGTFQMEVLYSFAGGKSGISYGKDYLSFSPCGLLWFMPGFLLNSLNNLSPQEGMLFLIPVMATTQFHIPISNHIEISAGWDALKFTQMKNYSKTFYLHGSVNAGVFFYLGDVMFLHAYYEFNHTHNPIIKLIGMDPQPKILNGQSFGIRFGAMLSRYKM